MHYAGFGKKLHHEIPSWVTDGSRFHIRIRCDKSTPRPLTETSLARALLDSVDHYEQRQRWHATIFLVMPDHLHAILSFPAQECKGRLKSEAGGAGWRGGPKVRHPEINMEDVHRYEAMDRDTTPGVG